MRNEPDSDEGPGVEGDLEQLDPTGSSDFELQGELDPEPSLTAVVLFLAFHIPVALAVKSVSAAATAHALTCLAAGLLWALGGRSYRVLYVAAYMVGAEVLWRGAHAAIPWEFCKYSLCLLFGVALIRAPSTGERRDWKFFLYALLLLPSLFVLERFDRQRIAFNLSGPICLAVTGLYLSRRRLGPGALQWTLLSMLAPILGLCFLASLGTYALLEEEPELAFTVSTKATSAGIGANQVSSTLGLGGLSALFLGILRPVGSGRFLLVGLAVWLLSQAALTFSRGGVWATVGAIACAGSYMLRDRRSSGRFVVSALTIALLVFLVVVPFLHEITGGALARRLSSTHATGREKIAQADWLVFLENPVLGVGPGQSYEEHARTYHASSAHTEFSRLLAEHGSFGILCLALLFLMTLERMRGCAPNAEKAVAVSFTLWALLFMGHSAMRLAAAAFMFGLGGAALRPFPGSDRERDQR